MSAMTELVMENSLGPCIDDCVTVCDAFRRREGAECEVSSQILHNAQVNLILKILSCLILPDSVLHYLRQGTKIALYRVPLALGINIHLGEIDLCHTLI